VITATGKGSFAIGYTNTGDITATGSSCMQIGPGTNTADSSIQLSSTIRMEGNSGSLFMDGQITMAETSAPGTAASNKVIIYCRDVGGVTKVFFKDQAGTEVDMGAAAGVPGATLVSVGDIVLNAGTLTSGSWRTLNLASTIGTEKALVMLGFHTPSGNNDLNAIAVRPLGDTNEYYDNAVENSAYGTSLGHHDADADLVLMTYTDGNGIIEYQCETTRTDMVTITLIGYVLQ